MSAEEFKRRLTAILSADVEGYSRLMRDDEEATVHTLTSYRTAMTHLIQQYRGRVVDSPGDNILAEFTSVVDAVNCGVEIQRELAERNAELPENRRMRFRLGINLGDVLEEGKRIYGDGVNIAARMESLAEAGEICISGTVYDAIENKIGLEYAYLGEQEVKNIDKPVRAYRVLSFPGAAAHRVVKAKRALSRNWRNTIIAMAAVIIVGAAAAVWHFYFRPPHMEVASVERMAFALPDKPSIAVLPFVNMSGDPEQEYFSDGITEDLITDLSQISGLLVISRNSTFGYKGKPVKIRQVAEEFGVRYVLEGSVRRADKQVRINAQLIDATTGHHLWAKRYDGHLGDVFALQDRITQKIVSALAVKLKEGEQEGLARKGTDNIKAYDAFLKGWGHYRRLTPEDFAKAIPYFEKAIELDTNYGRAHAALASVYWESRRGEDWYQVLGLSLGDLSKQMEKHLQAAMKNPTPLAHQVASKRLIVLFFHEEAIAEAERAIALDPNDAAGYAAMADALIFSGRPEEAVDFAKRAMRVDPHYPVDYLYALGMAHFGMEQFQEAASLFERAFKLKPEIGWVEATPLAAAYGYLGQEEKARACIDKYMKILRYDNFIYKNPEDKDRLLGGLRKAGLKW
jgi:TolB-like protein/class 3 adenylate cyclase/Flp pilus assembly protein TadD